MCEKYLCSCPAAQSCLTLCDSIDYLPDASVHGIVQARILEWVATSHSRGSSWPRDQIWVSGISFISRWILYHWVTWEASFLAQKYPWHSHLQRQSTPSGSECHLSKRSFLESPSFCTCTLPEVILETFLAFPAVHLCWVCTFCTLHSDLFSTPLCPAGCITQGPWACWLLLSWPPVGLGRRSGSRRGIQCSHSPSFLPAGSYSSPTTVPLRWPSSAAPSHPRLQEWQSPPFAPPTPRQVMAS